MKYTISGKVIRGDGYGKIIGFPTVNLEITQGNPVQIKQGVYAGVALLDGVEYRAGIVIGPKNKTEAHLIGYKGNAYGKKAEFTLIKFLRKFKKFKTEKELIKQIKNDIQLITRT